MACNLAPFSFGQQNPHTLLESDWNVSDNGDFRTSKPTVITTLHFCFSFFVCSHYQLTACGILSSTRALRVTFYTPFFETPSADVSTRKACL